MGLKLELNAIAEMFLGDRQGGGDIFQHMDAC
jgi:hypothetical protein